MIHTASPVLLEEPDNPEDIIAPAREGTMSVLRACSEAGTVRRIVLTSSVAAVLPGTKGMFSMVTSILYSGDIIVPTELEMQRYLLMLARMAMLYNILAPQDALASVLQNS